MPNRIVREGILTSSRLAQLNWPEEVFYRRLMSVVDDFGLYHATPMLLRAACYPLQLDKVNDSDIGKWLTACVEAALVRVYPASDGKRYLQLLDFRQQTRAKTSKYPASPSECVASAVQMNSTCSADAAQMHSRCIADAQQTLADAHLDVVGDGDGKSIRATARATRPKRRSLPANFGVSERVKAWAEEKGHGHLDAHLAHFVSYAKRSGRIYADWDEALMTAIRENWAKVESAQSNGVAL